MKAFWDAHKEFITMAGVIYGIGFVTIFIACCFGMPGPVHYLAVAGYLAAVLGLAATISFIGYFVSCLPFGDRND